MRRVGLFGLVSVSTLAIWCAAASAWTVPATVSGPTVDSSTPDVGVSADQSSVVVWQRSGVPSPLVQLASRSGSGVWGPTSTISSGDSPALAVNAAGTAAIVFRKASGLEQRVWLAVRDPNGSITGPTVLSVAGADADQPQVGIASDGTVVAAWRRADRVQMRVRQPDGTLGPVNTVSVGGGAASDPAVAVAPGGAAAVVWRRTRSLDTLVELAAVNGTGASPTHTLTGSDVATFPVVGVDDDGDAVAAWLRGGGVQTRTVSAAGTIGALANVSSPGAAADAPAIAVNPSGDAAFSWLQSDGANMRTQGRYRSSGGAFQPRQVLSGQNAEARPPQVDLTDAGKAVAAWDRRSATQTYSQARSFFADGTRGKLITVSATTEDVQSDPAVDVNETGGAAVGWLRSDGANQRVRVAVGAPRVRVDDAAIAYTEGDTVPVDSGLAVLDEDAALTGATVEITDNYVSGEDILGFSDQNGITGDFDAATGVLTLSGAARPADYESALRSVTYTNASQSPSTATRRISVQADDAAYTGEAESRGLGVTAVNDAPVITTPGATQTFTENGAPVTVDGTLTVTDVDSSIQGATAVIGGFVSGDRLNFSDQNGITGDFDAATRTLTLTGAATAADYQTALRSVTFESTSEDPTGATRTIDFQVTDSDGGSSATESQPVNVTAVNDAPVVITSPGSLAYTENQAATAIDSGLTLADVDNGSLQSATVQITGNYASGEDVLSFTNTPAITGTFDSGPGTLTLTGPASVADWQAALRNVAYRNSSENPSASPRTVTFTVNDGSDASNGATRDITVTPVNDNPNADDETFNGSQRAVGNTSLVGDDPTDGPPSTTGPNKTITGDILDGDTDVDDPASALSVAPGTFSTNDGGSVDLQSDGDFVYHPKAGTSCTDHSDFFDYTVRDDEPGTPGSDTGRVTIEIQDCVWYVDSALASNGDGRSHTPFNSLAGINGAGGAGDADVAGDRLFLYDGSYSGGLPLENNQLLLSQRNGLSVPDGGSGSVTLEPAAGGNTAITGGLTLGSNNTVQGIHLGNASGAALSGTSVGTVTMNTVTTGAIDNQTGPAVSINGGTLNMAFTGVSSNNSGGNGIALTSASGTFTASGGALGNATNADVALSGGSTNFTYDGSLTDDVGQLVSISGETGGTKDFNGAITDGNDGDGSGVNLSNNTGATVRFDGGLTLSTGANPAFTATGGGTLNVTDPAGAAANTATTTTGRAITVQNTTFGGSGFTFQSVSANGAPNGILLTNTGTTAGMTITGTGANNSGGSIQNTTGHGVSLTSTDNFSADELSITGADMAGVDGTQVTNFTFKNGQILNAGDSRTDPLHGSIAFNDQAAGTENNVDGTLVITGNLLKDHYGGGVDVFNRNGTITDATVSNNTIDSPADEALSKEDAISFNLFGSASTAASLTKAQIEDNVITDHPSGNGIVILGAGSNTGAAPTPTVGVPSSSTNRILIDGNLLTGDPTLRFGGAAILAGVEGRGQGNFDITNNGTVSNPITNVGTHGIAVGNSGSSTVDYDIENNRITANNFEAGALGIRAATDKNIMADGSTLSTPTMHTIISNNVVRNTTGGGIRVLASNSNGTSEVKVTNNDVANGGAGTVPIRVENGSSADASFDPTMCATISGNTTAANAPTAGGNTFPGIDLFKRSAASDLYQFGIVGLTPSPSTNPNTESFVTGLNPSASLGGGFYAGKRVSVDAGNNFVSCTHPAGF